MQAKLLSTSPRPSHGHDDQLRRAPFVFIACDASHCVEGWNDAATRLFGYTPEEAIGYRIEALIPPTGEPGGWAGLLDGVGDGVGEETRTWAHARKGGGAVVCDWSCQRDARNRGAIGVFGHDVTRLAARREEGRQDKALLESIHDELPLAVWRVDTQGNISYYAGKGLTEAGLRQGQYVGSNVFDVYSEESVGFVRKALAGEPTTHFTELEGAAWDGWVLPLRDAAGEVTGALGFSLNVTPLHRAHEELRAKTETIARQQKAIRDLSTPILQVWDGVLALPMIGVVDSTRTAAVMDDLLGAVARTQARFAILDLTGVEVVDTQTAAYLLDLIRAIQLLGAEGIITGIRQSVAQTIVGLGVDLGGILTLGNLQAGLRHCIAAMQRTAARSTR